MPVSSIFTARASSTATPMGWPVYPLVLATTMASAWAPKTWRSARTSADALPPRAGVYVSWDTKTVSEARAWRSTPHFASASATSRSMTSAMWSTSSRLPWKALLATTVLMTSQMGQSPRSAAASRSSTTSAAPPIPMMRPWRRRSKGRAASSTRASVAAAPEARKPDANHGNMWSVVMSSAVTTMTRRHLPAWIQSLASATACVPVEHAALVAVLGPRAPMYSANCEWPMDRTWKRKRRSKWYGWAPISDSSARMRASTSARATESDTASLRARSSSRRVRRARSS